MGSARSYVRSVWDQTRHVAAWIPLSKVELGEIYEVKKGVPQLMGRSMGRSGCGRPRLGSSSARAAAMGHLLVQVESVNRFG